jgi:hypothetical protein
VSDESNSKHLLITNKMGEKHKKIVLTLKQKLKLIEIYENGKLVTHRYCQCCHKTKEKKQGGDSKNEEEGESHEYICHSMTLQCTDTTILHGSQRVQI